MMATAFGLYIVNLFEAVTTREVLHAVITFGVAAPMLVFFLSGAARLPGCMNG